MQYNIVYYNIGQYSIVQYIWGPKVAVCDTLRHPFSPLDFLVKFILFSLKQLALFQIYNFFLQTQTLEISKLHDGVGGVAGYINFQTKKFQIS